MTQAQTTRVIDLPSGTLTVTTTNQTTDEFGLDDLCDFAARNNPKRGFLVVSKVLGRHIPSDPLVMDRVHKALARQLADADLPGPILFIGMAETAVCLGHAVHHAYRQMTLSQAGTLYIHSTRQMIVDTDARAGIMAEFKEPHSHAASHVVYDPERAIDRELLLHARTLVLIDDETSTGTTFINAARAMARLMPRLENVTTCVITDWSDAAAWRRELEWAGTSISMLQGKLDWQPKAGFVSSQPPVTNTGALGTVWNRADYGRRGTSSDHHRLPFGRSYDHMAAMVSHDDPADRYLVLGTGEFTYPAFLLALAMRRQNRQVMMQATTRSPVHVGGAIGCALTFEDNYGAEVPNFLYNAWPEAGQKVIICCETSADRIDPRLVSALDARVISFGQINAWEATA